MSEGLLEIVTDRVKEAILSIPEELISLDESVLEKRIRPNFTDEKLRIQFWLEYENASEQKRSMLIPNIHRGICSKQHFYKSVLGNPEKVAWLIIPPADYHASLLALSAKGLRRLNEFLDLPIEYKDGSPNPAMVDTVARIINMVDMRLKGAATQRVDINQKSVSVNINQNQQKEVVGTDTVREIENRLSQLKERERKFLTVVED